MGRALPPGESRILISLCARTKAPGERCPRCPMGSSVQFKWWLAAKLASAVKLRKAVRRPEAFTGTTETDRVTKGQAASCVQAVLRECE